MFDVREHRLDDLGSSSVGPLGRGVCEAGLHRCGLWAGLPAAFAVMRRHQNLTAALRELPDLTAVPVATVGQDLPDVGIDPDPREVLLSRGDGRGQLPTVRRDPGRAGGQDHLTITNGGLNVAALHQHPAMAHNRGVRIGQVVFGGRDRLALLLGQRAHRWASRLAPAGLGLMLVMPRDHLGPVSLYLHRAALGGVQ